MDALLAVQTNVQDADLVVLEDVRAGVLDVREDALAFVKVVRMPVHIVVSLVVEEDVKSIAQVGLKVKKRNII